MRLFDRIAMLAKADAHGVVESLEDRSLLLKQYVREAEIEVDRKRARVEALGLEGKRLGDDQRRLEERIAALDADIGLALGEGQEDLARHAIKKLLPLRAGLTRAKERLVEVSEERSQLTALLQNQEEELDALKTRVRAHLATPQDAPADAAADYYVSDEDVEMELLRRRTKGGQ
jgi:phage shock protein A